MKKETVAVVLFVIFLATYYQGAVLANESDWQKYENSHIVAYSDKSTGSILKLLERMEYFRAAVIQVVNIDAPVDAPKTQLVVFDSQRAFKNLVDSERIGGFATTIDGVPLMVVPSGGRGLLTQQRTQHEYAHVLLQYKNFPYPRWFREGFAELMETTTFRQQYKVFSVGEYSGKQFYSGRPTPWTELISEDFDPLKGTNRGHVSDAYLQCWMLTYYFMLADDFGHGEEFAAYLTLLTQGQRSVEAFESVVGEPVDQFGEKLRRRFVNQNLKYVTYDLRKENIDLHFEESAAAEDEILPLMEIIRGRYSEY